MLFLTRKVGESIMINGDISLTVTAIKGNQVKLSFSYPQGTQVLRQEIFNRIQEENRLAAQQTEAIHSLLRLQKATKP